jgi:FkbM family methyltransferase
MGSGTEPAGRGATRHRAPVVPTGVDAVVDTARRIWGHPENEGRRGRRLARWVAWQASQRTTGRPWTITLHGDVHMICHPHDHVTSLAMYCGLYDAAEMRFLLAWLRPGDTFVDVGANVAPYSLLASTVPGTRAVAFEPGSLARSRARANLALNGLADRITIEPLAVSDADGEATLTADLWAANALVEAGYDGAVERVPTIRLDTYAEDHDLGTVSLVKVDIEGHEVAALRGATAVIDRHRPALIVEVNDPLGPLRALAGELGYVAVQLDVRSRRLVDRRWPTRAGGNLVLVPDAEAARQRVADGIVQAFRS